MSQLCFENVSHRFDGDLVIDDFSLSVEDGEIISLLGPSGCGKTTSLRLAAGLEILQQGRIEIAGEEVASSAYSIPPEERRIGMVFQDYALFPHLTIRQNIEFGLHRMVAGDRPGRVTEVLQAVELTDRADHYPHQLSGGEQQRVALARALAPRPRLMLLDEPFANLDVSLRNQVRDHTVQLLKSLGTAAVVVTHDPEEAMRISDRVAVMRQGRIAQLGTPEDVYLRPIDRFMTRFFGPVTEIPVRRNGEGWVSPLGLISAAADTVGPDGILMLRPEAVDFAPAPESTTGPARVRDVRLQGQFWRAFLTLADGTELECLTTRRPPDIGTETGLKLDNERVFVLST